MNNYRIFVTKHIACQDNVQLKNSCGLCNQQKLVAREGKWVEGISGTAGTKTLIEKGCSNNRTTV